MNVKIKENRSLIILFILTFVVSYFLLAHFRNIPDDGAFYFKEASLLSTKGFLKELPWLRYTIWNNNFGGLHFLYPYLLIPFINLFGYFQASYIFTSLLLAFCLTIFCKVLETNDIKNAWLYGIILGLGSADFLFRMLLPRPLSLSLIILLFCYYLMSSKKYLPLLILSFLFVWLYDGYPVLLILAVSASISESIVYKRPKPNLLLIPLLGIMSGMIFYPYFPENFKFLHFIANGAIYPIQHIAEWAPYQLLYFLKTNYIVIVLWIVAVFFYFTETYKQRVIENKKTFLFLSSLFFLLSTLVFRRLIDYSVPFMLLFSVIALKDHLNSISFEKVKALKSVHFIVCLIIITTAISISFYYNATLVYKYTSDQKKLSSYELAASLIKERSQPGDIVFNSQWDQFPKLFFWNSSTYYIQGLDPVLMYKYDQGLFWMAQHISQNEKVTCTIPICKENIQSLAETIKNNFNSRFIFIEDLRNSNLKAELESSTLYHKIFQDQKFSVFELN